MSFFRNIRSSLASATSSRKSSSRDTTPVRSCNSRPASVISSRRDSTTSSTLQRGDTFIMNASDEEQQRATESNSSTLEKKSKKSKVFSKFSTFTKRKKTPSPEEVASYEHHPSDTATNTYYKWRSDGDRMSDYDAHSDPFNFLYEQQGKGRQSADASQGMQRQASLGSNSSGSFDSSTYRKSKTPTHLREQLEQLKTHSNDDLLEEDEREKYKTVTLNSFRKSFRDRLLQQQKETPHNPAWFVEVPPPPAAPQSSSRHESKENRPDFLVFENDNYRPQSRSPLRDRPSRSATRSPVKRNETFRVAQPTLRHMSPSPSPPPAPLPAPASSIRIEIKNSILPHSPGRLVPVGVAKPMPTTEYYAQRLLASSMARQPPPASNQSVGKWYRNQSQHSPTRLGGVPPQPQHHHHQQQHHQHQQHHQQHHPQQQHRGSGRYQTLVHIGSEQSKVAPTPARGRAPTRVQLYGSKPSSRLQFQQQQQHQVTPTYFGGHYNAPMPAAAATGKSMSSSRLSSGGAVGVSSINWGRREQSSPRAAPAPAPVPRRNRSPIKIPWR